MFVESVVALLVTTVALLWLLRRSFLLPLPPGPRGHLFSGIPSSLLKTEPWKTYAAWGVHYGAPILCFRVYNRITIIVNDYSAVHDLLERRAAIYSGRPMSWMFHVICGRGPAVFNISGLDPRHAVYRRLLQSGLGVQAVKDYTPILEDEINVLLRGLRETPAQFERHIRRNATAVIMKVAFGYSVLDNDDPFISIADESSKISGWAMAPGRWLVDYLPILRFVPAWFPFAQFQRQGAEWRKTLEFVSDVPHNWVKEQMAAGTNIPSFTSRLLKPGMSEEEEDIVKWCAGALNAGAADTSQSTEVILSKTVSALISFIMLMALHPTIQDQARDEIDANIGRLPRVSDLDRLPFLRAVLKEVMRFAPVGNLALPHQATQDDVYGGYRIPAGSTVIPNVWAILHDPELYPDPFVFDPARFFSGSDSASAGLSGRAGQPDPYAYVWGFGRRRCPGIQFAEPALLLAMACILHTFVIHPELAENVQLEFTTGITSHIKPFGVRFTERWPDSQVPPSKIPPPTVELRPRLYTRVKL
ncbi:cytochrome P450 [Favolaschia claudopus]|uniref:Cytochrome P450 n=1 Tax=Favolaschia claudopus TaxID=2862362 RepID=A0AAW0DQY3_9AGAR